MLNGLNRTVEASACFCKVITLQPKHREGRRLLALAHCVLGEVDRAVEILTEWLEEEPGNPIAVHMLAAATGGDVPLRASNAFVKNTFDSFAASFEAKLESLSYRAPKLVAAALVDAGLPAEHRLDVLDAGCGTGLCGPLLARTRRGWSESTCPAACWSIAEQERVLRTGAAELTAFLRARRKVRRDRRRRHPGLFR